MYKDTIKVANKIISDEDLREIFEAMYEKLQHYKKISTNEAVQNQVLEYRYQKWTFNDNGSRLTFDVNFYDDTSIKFDNYENFFSIFNTRLDEIKSIMVSFVMTYGVKEIEGQSLYHHQTIHLWIYENKMDIDIALESSDKKIDDIYELIKNKILTAPPKYDDVIKKKSSINTSVGISIGLIPAMIIATLLLFIPIIRQIFVSSFVLYPVCVLMLTFFIGFTMGGIKLNPLYKSIQPEQKYAGYDSNKGKSIYKDDIEQYTKTSEILIGKNVDNLICRKQIMEIYDKYRKCLWPKIGILVVLSIIVLFL